MIDGSRQIEKERKEQKTKTAVFICQFGGRVHQYNRQLYFPVKACKINPFLTTAPELFSLDFKTPLFRDP